MFWQRAVVAFTLGPLVIYLIYLGGLFYAVPVAAVCSLATFEYANITKHLSLKTPTWLLLPLVLAQMAVSYWPTLPNGFELAGPVFFGAMFAILLHILWQYESQNSKNLALSWMACILGFVLLGWLGGHAIRIRQVVWEPLVSAENAWQWTTLIITTTWAADTFAYLVGKFVAGRFGFGRHALVPHLSPNKTVEGYVGSVILGLVFSTVTGIVIFDLPAWPVLLIASAICITSTAGDLSISLLKRESGVKDSGTFLPGHGGALDRIDTLLWSIALAYYLLYTIAQFYL